MEKVKIALVAFVIFCGTSSVSAFAASKITADEAKKIALGAVDTQQVGGITDVELEKEKGVLVYAVEFTKNGIETDVKIDAFSGKVVVVESDRDEADRD